MTIQILKENKFLLYVKENKYVIIVKIPQPIAIGASFILYSSPKKPIISNLKILTILYFLFSPIIYLYFAIYLIILIIGLIIELIIELFRYIKNNYKL